MISAGKDHIDGAFSNSCHSQQPGKRRSGPPGSANRLGQPRLADRAWQQLGPTVTCAFERYDRGDLRPALDRLQTERQAALDKTVNDQFKGARIDGGNVVVNEQIVQTRRGDVPP